MDPEKIHEEVVFLGQYFSHGLVKNLLNLNLNYEHTLLETDFCGSHYKNPVGLAAGFDKNGLLLDFLPALGFAFAELGTVTKNPWAGNPKPRIFRLTEDQAIINRMGLPNLGSNFVKEKLSGKNFTIPYGVNFGKTPDPLIQGRNGIQNFLEAYQDLAQFGNYHTLNISCPNTHEGKTFEDLGLLKELLTEIKQFRSHKQIKTPLLLKLSPDLDFKYLHSLLELVIDFDVLGFVVCNTSTKRIGLKTNEHIIKSIGLGGLSGSPLKESRLAMLKEIRRHWPTAKLIGVGGISSPEDAWETFQAGAELIQIYTGMIYEGPSLIKRINKALVKRLSKEGYKSFGEFLNHVR